MAQLTQAPQPQNAPTSTAPAGARESSGLAGQTRGMSFADGEALLNPARERYTVRPGDTLGIIAKRTLGSPGRWQEIHQLNLETIGPNPDRIRPGQVLVLPADAQVATSHDAKAPAPTPPTTAPAPKASAPTPAPTQAPQAPKAPKAPAPSLESQMTGLANRVAGGVRTSPVVQEATKKQQPDKPQRFEKRDDGPKDRVLFSQSDPLLGQFQVVLNLDGDLTAKASQRYLHITSAGGLLLRTPEGMSDLLIRSAILDLRTMDVRVQSEPEVGPLEQKIISSVLRDTILAQAPELAGQGQGGPLAAAMATLPSAKGKKVAYDYKALGVSVLSVLIDPATAASVTFNGKGLNISMWPGIVVDTVGPDFTIGGLRYHFATATFDIDQQGSTTVLGVIGDQLKQPLLDGVEAVGARFFSGKLPAAMRAAGYDPTVDPKFEENLDTLYKNFTGVSLLGGRPGEKQGAGGQTPGAGRGQTQAPTSATPGAAAAPQAGGDKGKAPDRQVLYQFSSKDFGAVEVCLEPGDAVQIYKDDTAVGLDAGRGLFLRVPGHAWLQDVRLTGIRYRLADGRLDFEGTDKMGEFVRSVLEDVVNAYVIPSLPGDVRRGVGLEGQGDAKHQVLYSADVAGAGKVELLLDKGDRLSLSKAEDVVELSAGRGLILKAPALPSLAKLRIMKVHYVLGTDELRVDSDNDLGPAGEKILGSLIKAHVVPQLPGGVGVKADAPKIDKATLAAFPNVAFTQKAGALGTVEARLAGGDTLGVRTDGVTATVYAKAGVLLVVPDAGIALTLRSVSLNRETGAVDVEASERFGSLERSLLSDIARKFVTPVVDQHYKAPQQAPGDADHRVLYHFADKNLDLDVCLDKGDAVQVEKTDEALTLSAGKGILLRAKPGGLLPESTRISRVRVDMRDGSVVVDSNPDVGALGELLGTQVLRELVLPHLPPQLQSFGIATPSQDAVAAATAPLPKPDGLMLLETSLDGVGPFDVSVNGASAMKVEASSGALSVSAPSGILVRVPGLKLSTRVTQLDVDLQGGNVNLTASTALGAFEQRLLSGLFRMHAMAMVSKYVTTPAKEAGAGGDFDVLYSYTADKVGRVSVCVPKGGSVSLQKSDTHVSLVAPKGVFFTGVDWLPDFRVQRVDYELGTGKFGIDVSGVAQGRYVEGQDVGPLTEAVVGNLVKALVGPHLPPQAQAIGVVGQQPGKGPQGPPPGATLLKQVAAGSLGDIGVYLDAGDSLSISATEIAGQVRSARGLIIDAPALRTRERIRFIKYAFQTGEVQVDGLGALENAILERALIEFVVPLLPKQYQGDTPVGQAMAALPKDKKGRSQLVDGDIGVAMSPGTRFDVTLDGQGLKFDVRPGLHVDGPLIANFELESVRYSFSEQHFRLDLSGSNVIAKAIDGIARKKAEKKLDEMFLPLLPAEMSKPGYDLTKDPHLAETLAQIGKNFAANKK